jgi:hypothetical protein
LAIQLLWLLQADIIRRFLTICILCFATLAPVLASAIAADVNSSVGLAVGQVVEDAQGNGSGNIVLSAPDQSIGALQFDLQYPAQAMTITESLGSAAIRAGKSLWTSNPQTATKRFLIAGFNEASLGNGTVVTLSIHVASGTSPGLHQGCTPSSSSMSRRRTVQDPLGLLQLASDGSVSVLSTGVVAVTNAASYAAGSVAPGEMLVIWGGSLAGAVVNTLQVTATGFVSTSLGGTRVLFDGIPAPLVYTTENQLCAIVPYEVDGQLHTSLQVEFQGTRTAPFVLPVTKSSPGLFTLDGSGQGQGAILNQDGTINGPLNPAPRGLRYPSSIPAKDKPLRRAWTGGLWRRHRCGNRYCR